MPQIKVFSFSLSSLGNDVQIQASDSVGFPFIIRSILVSANVALDQDHRLRVFVALDDDTDQTNPPSGTNILADGGGDNYIVPFDEPQQLGVGFVEPGYNRHLKAELENLGAVSLTVLGAVTVEAL